MDHFCPNCGAPISEGGRFCAACDASVEKMSETRSSSQLEQDSTPNVPVAEHPKKNKPRWIIPVCAIVALILAAVFLWKPIFMRLAPHAYLNWTLTRTNADIEKRQEGTLSELLTTVTDCFKKGSVDLKLEYENPQLVGQSELDFSISFKSDIDKKQWLTQAYIMGAGNNMELSMYIGSDHLSVGSSLVQNGQHFGIAYSTVEEDLRSSIFGSSLTDEQISTIADLVEMVEDAIKNADNSKDAYEPYQQLLKDFAKELKPEIGKTKLEIDGKQKNCDTMTFVIEQDQMMDLMEDILELLQEDEAMQFTDEAIEQYEQYLVTFKKECDMELEFTYCFYRNKIAAMDIRIEGEFGEENMDIALDIHADYGADASTNDIIVDFEIDLDGQTVDGSIVSYVEKTWGSCKEALVLRAQGEALEQDINIAISTDWDRTGETLELSIDIQGLGEAMDLTIPVVLKEKDGGFDFYIKNLLDFSDAVIKDNPQLIPDFKPTEQKEACSLLIKVRNECSITIPEYTNLDQITAEDLIEFMRLFGSVGLGGNAEEDIYG